MNKPVIALGLNQSSTPLTFQQDWRDTEEEGFRPAWAILRREASHLVVQAELTDDDLFNAEPRSHQPFYRHGDVFEIFLRPTRQDAYTELHVGPDNQTFHLRIPSAELFLRHRADPEAWRRWLVPERRFVSRVFLNRATATWRVEASIPLCEVGDDPIQPGDRWLFSFSRYDYTRGRPEPVLSSTSPHTELNYHAQTEWGTLIFA